MNNDIHIASLVVHSDPKQTAAITETIKSMQGAELHNIDAPGKLVVLLEADSEKLITDYINTISATEGVHSTSLVYHHHEPAEALAEEINP